MRNDLTTAEAADEIGISVSRVKALIYDGTLRAKKRGRDWLINPDDVAREAERRRRGEARAGRPRQRR